VGSEPSKALLSCHEDRMFGRSWGSSTKGLEAVSDGVVGVEASSDCAYDSNEGMVSAVWVRICNPVSGSCGWKGPAGSIVLGV
jgi:hypothetical protein